MLLSSDCLTPILPRNKSQQVIDPTRQATPQHLTYYWIITLMLSIINKTIGANLSKYLRQNYQNIFEQPNSDFSDDDGIDFDFCLLSRLGVPIITIQSDDSD